MKLTKKISSVFIAAILIITATACSSSSSSDKPDSDKAESTMPPLEFKNGEAINLWDNTEDIPGYIEDTTPQAVTLTPYISENNENGGCVIICPGGGYNHVTTEKEGTLPAIAFNEQGISAFVLNYRVTPYTYKETLCDIFRAVRFVRSQAKEFGVDPDKIAVMGFSAGGHLSAMALEHYDEDIQQLDVIDEASARPDFGILCYPVITMTDPYCHKGSRTNFLGEDGESDTALQQKYSAELGVTEDTPPCFIWHCKPDTSVPYQNSQMFADAMADAGVECKYCLYERGSHGLGLATGMNEVGNWFPDCVEWLKSHGY